MSSDGQVDLVLVEDILKCSTEVVGDASYTRKAATAAGSGVDWSVKVDNDPWGDAPVDSCQIIRDEPATISSTFASGYVKYVSCLLHPMTWYTKPSKNRKKALEMLPGQFRACPV